MPEVLLSSRDDNFILMLREGTTRDNTPYKKLEVKSQGLADKHVVEIRLEEDYFSPNPKYSGVSIAHGMRMKTDSLSETAEYIKVLEEALDFAYRINSYIENHSEWKK